MLLESVTDHNIGSTESLIAQVKDLTQSSLELYESHLTRVIVHLSDENAGKSGVKDKRCLIEARLEHLSPLVVESRDSNLVLALEATLKKLERSLSTVMDKRRYGRHDQHPPEVNDLLQD